MFGIDPGLSVLRQASGGDEHVDVRMKQHGASPGVKNGQNARTGAQECRVAGESLKSIGSGFHHQSVDLFGVGPRERTQLSGKRKGHEEIGTRQQAASLRGQPALGLILVTLRTGTIAAGVVGEDFLLTVIALVEVATKERRTASGNILERPFPIGVQGVSILLAVRRAMEANDIGHLQHEDPG